MHNDNYVIVPDCHGKDKAFVLNEPSVFGCFPVELFFQGHLRSPWNPPEGAGEGGWGEGH